MGRRRSLLSDETKMYLAQVQGAGDRARPGDYGLLTSREAGSFVKYAIMAAEQTLAGQNPAGLAGQTPAGQVPAAPGAPGVTTR